MFDELFDECQADAQDKNNTKAIDEQVKTKIYEKIQKKFQHDDIVIKED